MQVHSNATTNKKQRERLRLSHKTCRTLAEEMAVSLGTIHRWKHRDSPEDKSCRPNTIEYAFDPAEQTMILSLRQKGLPLDDLVDLVQQPLPEASRSSVYRLLKRNGVSRLPKKRGARDRARRQTWSVQGLRPWLRPHGLLLPAQARRQEALLLCCHFVAIDRATRLSFLAVYEHKDKKAATDFLKRCLLFFPFQVSKVLTDNGREFTLEGFKNRWGTSVKTVHDFEQVCQEQAIEHRTTLPYTPKTNGMVERMNGLTKENTTKRSRYVTAQEMQADLHGWFVRYNFCRKNRRIGGKTPYEATLAWYKKDPSLFHKEPAALLAYRS